MGSHLSCILHAAASFKPHCFMLHAFLLFSCPLLQQAKHANHLPHEATASRDSRHGRAMSSTRPGSLSIATVQWSIFSKSALR